MRKAITTCRLIAVHAARIALTVLLAVVATTTPASAQEEEQTTEKNTKKPGYFYRASNGELIPLSDRGVSPQDIENLIRGKEPIVAPQFVLSAIELDGEVRGKLAFLDATVKVQLTVDDSWIAVPIAMDDGKLAAPPKYKGDGQHMFGRETTAETGTRMWLFKGVGIHELTLPMVVSVREPQHLSLIHI